MHFPLPTQRKIYLAIVLLTIGIGGRLLLKDLPNIETVMVASLLAGSLLGGLYSVFIPLTIIAITDMYLGNDPILLFTWSAWGVIGLTGLVLRKRRGFKPAFICGLTGIGILSSLFFYLYTNFGVWLLWDMYPHTLAGLIQCYVMGLPFFLRHLASDLILIPTISSIFLGALFYCQKYKRFLNLVFASLARALRANSQSRSLR